ncbi:MATE family efflux transporter [Brevibacillus nitrificans]|uniref:MATE family efflux transporter n=1 Tax=Brevibacillus nitrificans TaxID=651560 RepID=UPI0026107458|nr:MATE family efflux transporter [Brevibacillus nitrificans]MED1793377.1 MATE family efflux transporter [Brevibacillus nitrificans]
MITPITQRQFLAVAVPVLLAGISAPVIGAVDTAVVGTLPDPAFIGAVAVGSLIFNNLYWPLGFLRVGTIGFTAQAQGVNSQHEMTLAFLRPLAIALFFGGLFVIAQHPILHFALFLISPGEGVSKYASSYFSIRIWGAPFALMLSVINGWLMGMGKIRYAFLLLMFMNGLNIALSVFFVIGLGWNVAGTATAALFSELCTFTIGAVIVFRMRQLVLGRENMAAILETKPLLKMLKVNQDLFIRTICLLSVFTIMTAKGAALGELTLAANAILLQLHFIMAYLFSGFADASSIFVGRAVGKKDPALFRRAYSLTAWWGMGTAIALALGIGLAGNSLLAVFTSIGAVQEYATHFLLWMILYPIASFWGLQLEGIFIGSTEVRQIRNAMLASFLLYLGMLGVLTPLFGNHGVWAAYLLFNLSRSLFLWLYVPSLSRRMQEEGAAKGAAG